MKKEYAIYKGEECLFIGTIEEVVEHFRVKKKTVSFWASPANCRYADTGFRNGQKKEREKSLKSK